MCCAGGRLWRFVLSSGSVGGSGCLALSLWALSSGHCFFLVSFSGNQPLVVRALRRGRTAEKGRRPENRFFRQVPPCTHGVHDSGIGRGVLGTLVLFSWFVFPPRLFTPSRGAKRIHCAEVLHCGFGPHWFEKDLGSEVVFWFDVAHVLVHSSFSVPLP